MKSTRVRSNLLIAAGVLVLGFAGVRAVQGVVRPAPPQRDAALSLTAVAQLSTATATLSLSTASLASATPSSTEMAASPSATVTVATTVKEGTATMAATSPEATSSEVTSTGAASTKAATILPSATPAAAAMATISPTATPVATVAPTQSPTWVVAVTPAPPRIVIPKIGVNASTVSVSWSVQELNEGVVAQWETADPGLVGHHLGTALPGDVGNVVMSGHGTDQGVFSRLGELEPGDEITIELSDSESHVYRVEESVLLPEVGASHQQKLANARYMEPTDDARLTLITCWPAWAYTHRLVVVAGMQAP